MRYWPCLLLAAFALGIAWPIPYCIYNGFSVNWLNDRGFVCWVERPTPSNNLS